MKMRQSFVAWTNESVMRIALRISFTELWEEWLSRHMDDVWIGAKIMIRKGRITSVVSKLAVRGVSWTWGYHVKLGDGIDESVIVWKSKKGEHCSKLWRMGLNWVPGVALVEPVASVGWEAGCYEGSGCRQPRGWERDRDPSWLDKGVNNVAGS